LLYEEKLISNQTIAIRKSISYNEPDIRISFSNEYGYNISIIPIYENGKLKFDTNYKMKSSN